MRPHYLLLLVLTFFIVCGDSALARASTSVGTADSVIDTKRFLRAETLTNSHTQLADEERGFNLPGLTWFRFWRLRRVADKLKTTDVISAKESKWIDSWVKKDLNPQYVYKKLGLTKQGDKAMQSQNYRLFEAYTERMFAKDQALYNSWLAKKMTPEDVYKALKLDKLKGAKAAESKDFRRYEVYVFKWYEPKI
ncbi:hypothetical protein AM587_10004929 [Phytophthora nicotianae]|uniref:RxLR effector protein n=2 Tax=Phytophthora nicotianae TaxID=4792 RepID=A0A0W8CF58_PHYNI|nr:hypothetical protein F444_03016 [Phytophthora nicotianae P1976]KUF82751.1 hypothetical protein AM588_10001009 [Phytophthora nicotianae]KUF87674.1 hypothetical protein AM587_10004929 [Phytophthora nicotianae]